jgi:hypothetical protein
MTIRARLLFTLPGAALLALAQPAAAQIGEPDSTGNVTAEQAMETYRARFKSVDEIDCPHTEDPDEILVCGRVGAPDPNRLPLPVPDHEPGDRIRGEPATGAAFNCLHNCYQGLDVLKMIKTGKKIIDHILHPD